MSVYSLNIKSENIYLINLSNLEERYDPFFYKDEYLELDKILNSISVSRNLKSIRAYIKKGVFDMSPNKYTKEGVPFLRVSDITYEGMDFSSTVFISEKTHTEEIKTEFLPGDLVIAKIGHTIGKVSVLPDTFEKYNISQNVIGIKLSDEIRKFLNPMYLKIFLTSNFGKKQVIRQSSQGGQPKITLDAIRKVIVPIFELKQQEKIVANYYEALKTKKTLEEESNSLIKSIDKYLLTELGLTKPVKDQSLKGRIYTTNYSEITGRRFDSVHSDIYFKNIISAINNGKYSSTKLKNILSKVNRKFKPIEGEIYNYIQLGSIGRESSEVIKPLEISIPNIPSRAQQVVKENDILFSNANPQWGVHILVNKENNDFVASSGFNIYSSNGINNFYVELLRSSIYKELYKKYLVGAGLFLNISDNDLKSIVVPIVPIDKQNEISETIINMRSDAKRLKEKGVLMLEKANKIIEHTIMEV